MYKTPIKEFLNVNIAPLSIVWQKKTIGMINDKEVKSSCHFSLIMSPAPMFAIATKKDLIKVQMLRTF